MAANSPTGLGPYSRQLVRGALGRINGSTAEGRFLRATETALIEHIGSKPSIAERLMIARLSRILLRLHMLDEKIAAGNGTDLDIRTIGGLDSALRNGLKTIGLKPTPKPAPTLQEIAAQIAAEKASAAA